MLICDSESDSFKYESTKIWVICAYDTDTDSYSFSFDKSVSGVSIVYDKLAFSGVEYDVYSDHAEHLDHMQQKEVCFHNYFQHDKPLIKKFYPEFAPAKEHDSYILSQLFNPDRGKHGLAAWGERFGHPKPVHEEWDRFSPEMLHRVIEDVKINVKVWEALQEEKKQWEDEGGSWDEAIRIEYAIADLQGRQEMHGVLLDQEKAYSLADEIYTEIQKIDEKLLSEMPPRIVKGTVVDEPFKKDGTLKKLVTDWDENIKGAFCKQSIERINLNSTQQVNKFLLTQGWIPKEYTPTGLPKLTEESYDSIKGELGQLIAKRAVLRHRAQMIFNVTKQGKLKGFLNIVRDDGRIEAAAITNGTNTGRMTHRNLVNVPKPKDYKKNLWPSNIELRELFIVPDDKLMMGIDADGLEARVMAHCVKPYRGGEEYAKLVLEGDIHASNAAIFETDRDGAKSPYYCLMYGGQPKKLGETLGCTTGKAKRIFDRFWRESTALDGFKKAITKYWKTTGNKKFIKGIDGRKIWIRSEHSIVNAYFQSTGSITVKVAALFFDKWLRQRDMQSHQVIIYHDELEVEVFPEEKEIVTELSAKAFVKSGEYLKLRVPITGSPKFGSNWKEVH